MYQTGLDFYRVIDLVKQTGQAGQELLVDSFILGVAFGRRQIETLSEIQNAVNKLLNLKQKIDESEASPFVRDQFFGKYLADKNDLLFADCQAKNLAILKPKIEVQQQPQQINQILSCSLCGFMFINQNLSEICELFECKHKFHIKCFYIYIQKNKNNCPTCKKPQDNDFPELLFEQLDSKYKSCCPTFGCDQQFIYFGQQSHYCKKCQRSYCLLCKKETHYQQKCQFELEHFNMTMGEKFKYCTICKKSIFQYNDSVMIHECASPQQKERKRDKVSKFLKQSFDVNIQF